MRKYKWTKDKDQHRCKTQPDIFKAATPNFEEEAQEKLREISLTD